MKYSIFLILFYLIFTTGCNQDDYQIDTGKAKGVHDCTVWEFMQQQKGAFDSAVIIIQRAGLADLFAGRSEHKEITVFAFSNYAVMNFLFETVDEDDNQLYHSVAEIPVELCKRFVLSHVIPVRMMRTDFDYEIPGTNTGGSDVVTLADTKLRVYRVKNPYWGVSDAGPETLFLQTEQYGITVQITTTDNQCTNGIVHSLSNTYILTELK